MASRVALAVLLALSALLVFASLDNRFLWDDEAENALLAQRTLAVGLPVARDARGHVISTVCGADADENYLWTLHGWLPIYLTAASFKLFGVSTLSARLPFAILGWLTIPSLYVVGRRLFRDRWLALLACGFLTGSVLFLLHVRQSRWYGAAIFAGVWVLHFFLATAEGGRLGPVGLVVASTVMLHSNPSMFAATFAALLVAFVVLSFDRRAVGRLLAAGAAVVVVNAPWLPIYASGALGGVRAAPDAPAQLWSKAGELLFAFSVYARKIDHVALPVLVMLLFGVWLLLEGREAVWTSPGFRRWGFLAVFALVYVLAVSVWATMYLRYVVNLLPVLALLQAYVVRTVGLRRPVAAAATALVILTSDAAHGWTSGVAHRLESAEPVRFPLFGYLGELTHDFDGPIEAIVGHLKKEGRPGDRVYISYGDLPLRFYTDFEVRGGQGCQSPVVVPPPEWVIVRFFFRTMNEAPGTPEDIRRHLRYVQEEIPWRLYQRIELPQVDTVWENVAEPQWHHFRTPQVGPRVIVFRRVRDPASLATGPALPAARASGERRSTR